MDVYLIKPQRINTLAVNVHFIIIHLACDSRFYDFQSDTVTLCCLLINFLNSFSIA